MKHGDTMKTTDLERYLLQNGFDTRIAPEVWMILKEDLGIDLLKQDAALLSLPNDSVRMDIRIAAVDVMRRREKVAKTHGVPVNEVPVHVQWT